MKTIGLISGASWEATASYYRVINESVRQFNGGLCSPPLLMHSFNAEEISRLQQVGAWTELTERVIRTASSVYEAGARCIAICALGLHRIAPEVMAALPDDAMLLHIGDALGMALRQAGVQRIGFLSARQDMEQPFLAGYLRLHHGIDTYVPGSSDRARVHEICHSELRRGVTRAESRRDLLEMALTMRHVHDIQAIVLGSYDLCELMGEESAAFPLPRFDSAMLHARSIADYVLFHPVPAQPQSYKQHSIGQLVREVY